MSTATLATTSVATLARLVLGAHPHLDTPVALADQLRISYPRVAAFSREATRITCKRVLEQKTTAQPQPEALPTKPTLEKLLREDGTLLVTAGQIKTLPDFLAAAQVNLSEYQLVKHKINKWDVTSTRLGKPILAENWQVTAEFKPLNQPTELDVREIGELLGRLAPLSKVARPAKAQGVLREPGCLYELAIFDAHLGKLCDPDESGSGYDLETACATFMAAVEKLLARAAGYQIDRFLLPLGNDFFNSDHLFNATTAGTPQHEAARWRRVFVRGTALVVAVIERLRQVAPVDVIIVPGNHDKQRAFYLGEVIAGRYEATGDVTVNNDHKPRKYYQWGQCGLMFTHGNEEREGDLAQIFATENKRLWADTDYREIHCGHKHRKSDLRRTLRNEQESREYMGALVRFLRALSDTDAWHNERGYIGNQRAAEGYMWSKTEGVIGNFSVNI